jgi:hypothetical protein
MKTLQKTSFEKKQCKSQALKNNTAKGAFSRTRMKRQRSQGLQCNRKATRKINAKSKLLSRILKKESFQEQEYKGKLSRTRMQKQALKNYNAKGKLHEQSMQERQTL